MTSRTRKSKTRVLIAFGKGIASTLALELAMLFCHAGTEVRAAFIDNADDWITQAPIKQISGHSVLTSGHQPAWYFADSLFDSAIIVAPSSLSQKQISEETSNDLVIEFICKHCPLIQILQTRSMLPSADSFNPERLSFFELPAQPALLRPLFQRVFAETTARMAARKKMQKKTFSLHYAVPEPLKNSFTDQPGWVAKLSRAMQQAGLSSARDTDSADVKISAYDGPGINSSGSIFHALPEKDATETGSLQISFIADQIPDDSVVASHSHLFIKRLPNGLKVFDINGVRIIPNVTGQCAFSRLSSYITTHLQRVLEPSPQG